MIAARGARLFVFYQRSSKHLEEDVILDTLCCATKSDLDVKQTHIRFVYSIYQLSLVWSVFDGNERETLFITVF